MTFYQSIKDNKREIFLLLFTLIICFLIFELAVRALWYPPQDKGYPKELHIIDENLGYKLAPNYKGNFPMALYEDKEISVNSKGLRDIEHDYSKPSNTKRILGLGDSVTFGSGVNNNETYLKVLEQQLNNDGKKVEVINAGVSGYEFSQEYDFYNREGYKYDSDVIIVGIVLNDLAEPNISQIKENMKTFGYHDRPADTEDQKFIKNLCHSCVFIYGLINNYNNKYFDVIYNSWSDTVLFNKYTSRLDNLNQGLNSENKQLVLVIFPYTQQFSHSSNSGTLPQQEIKAFADSRNIEVIDLLPYLDVPNYKDLYIYGDNLHLNSQGNELVGKVIKNELESRKIV